MRFFIFILAFFISFPAHALSVKTLNGRTAYIHTPVCATAQSPALIVLHPGYSNALIFRSWLNIESVSDEICAKVAYLEGSPTQEYPSLRTWDAGDCCGSESDDIAFFEDAAEYLNAPETYVMGFSNGAMMAYRVLCERPELIDGMVSMAGTLALDQSSCEASITAPVIHTHGLNDTIIPYAGGPGPEGITVVPFSELKAGFESRGVEFTVYELQDTGHSFPDQRSALDAQYDKDIRVLIVDMMGDLSTPD